MIDLIMNLVEGAIGAFVAYLAYKGADAVIAEVTGKTIPQHLSNAWSQISGDLIHWLAENKGKKIARIVAVIAQRIDPVMVGLGQKVDVRFDALVQDSKVPVTITTRRLSAKEAVELFPQLATQNIALVVGSA
jgi:hypothetical protein